MAAEGVKECRIFGFHDRVYGEDLAACVTLEPGASFDEAAVRGYVKSRVGSYKTPKHFFVYEAFPLNANGKIDQRSLHTDMLRCLRRMELNGELEKGVRIAALSIKNSTYGIVPVAAMLEEYALCLGFEARKAARIRLAAEETLTMRVNETARDIGDIDLELLCFHDHLRLTCTDAGLSLDEDPTPEQCMSRAIVLRMVDDSMMKQLPNGRYIVSLDFLYDKEFDVRDFLMQHERIG